MKISPSLMGINLLTLEEDIRFFDRHADLLHVDIMDGHFVKNITMGPSLIAQVRPITKLPIEAHLMMTDPEMLIDQCVEAGADFITLHIEAVNGSAIRLIDKIRSMGKKAGIAVNPETPLANLEMILEYVDLVNFMTIDPGFAGTRFIPAVLEKVQATRDIRVRDSGDFLIQVDGSVGPETYTQVKEAGADIIIAGQPTLFSLADTVPDAWKEMLEFVV